MFTPWGCVLWVFLLRIWPNLMSGPGEIFFLQFFIFYYYFLFFYGKKKFEFFCFLRIETQNPLDLPDKKTTFAELVKSATNPPTHQK
jgi:hypothetical protein